MSGPFMTSGPILRITNASSSSHVPSQAQCPKAPDVCGSSPLTGTAHGPDNSREKPMPVPFLATAVTAEPTECRLAALADRSEDREDDEEEEESRWCCERLPRQLRSLLR